MAELKIVIPSSDWGQGSPMDLQEPIDQALAEAGLGEVVRGGAAPGHFFLIVDTGDPSAARKLLANTLRRLSAPDSVRFE